MLNKSASTPDKENPKGSSVLIPESLSDDEEPDAEPDEDPVEPVSALKETTAS